MERNHDSTDLSHLSKIRSDSARRLHKYVPPKWADDLRWKPKTKIDLCQKNTPISKWYLPNIPNDFEIYIKRDDMTGGAVSGHKIRRLEFSFAEALEKNCDTVIACGAITSNNCRTLAAAGKELGFTVHLCLYNTTNEKMTFHGNLFISKFLGANLYLTSDVESSTSQQNELIKLLSAKGHSPYIIKHGEPGDVGIFGYIDCFEELMSQAVTERFSDLVITCASGLAAAAFIIGNERNGGKLRLHAFSVSRTEDDLRRQIFGFLKDVGFLPEYYKGEDFHSLINIVEESLLPGYALFDDKHTEFVSEVAKSSGILLDPVYTGKSVYQMVSNIQTSPETFHGKRILFYNTGSVIGAINDKLYRAVIGR